jgi:hypothetical protein
MSNVSRVLPSTTIYYLEADSFAQHGAETTPVEVTLYS